MAEGGWKKWSPTIRRIERTEDADGTDTEGDIHAGISGEAVKLVETTGMSVARAAKQLSVPKSSLDNWVRAARAGKLADVGKGQRLPSELELELARARKEMAEVKLERDLQKRVWRFSRRSRGEMRPDR